MIKSSNGTELLSPQHDLALCEFAEKIFIPRWCRTPWISWGSGIRRCASTCGLFIPPVRWRVGPARTGFALEALSELCGRDFDGNRTFEPGVARLPDLAHAARADVREDRVRPELNTRPQRHPVAPLRKVKQLFTPHAPGRSFNSRLR